MNRYVALACMIGLAAASGCGLPVPAQYDHATLREYFGKSPKEVEETFGKPTSVSRSDPQSPTQDATNEQRKQFDEDTESMRCQYSTVDGDLVFHFDLNEKVHTITYLGRSVTPPESASPATAFLVDMDGVKHRLPQAEADFLAGLVSARPDVETTDHISLDPPYRVIVDGVDLALEPDELILMHRDRTKRWKSSAVRARILAATGIKWDPT